MPKNNHLEPHTHTFKALMIACKYPDHVTLPSNSICSSVKSVGLPESVLAKLNESEIEIINTLHPGIQNGRHEKSVCKNLKKFTFGNILLKLEANRLGPISGPTHVGPDLGPSLFAIVQNTDRVSCLN